MNSSTPSLSGLPTELLEYVAQTLAFEDLCSFRLASWDTNYKSCRTVGERLCGTVRSTLQGESMVKLQTIAAHAYFGQCVRHVEIEDVSDPPANDWTAEPDAAIDLDQFEISHLPDLLYSKMINCKTIAIISHNTAFTKYCGTTEESNDISESRAFAIANMITTVDLPPVVSVKHSPAGGSTTITLYLDRALERSESCRSNTLLRDLALNARMENMVPDTPLPEHMRHWITSTIIRSPCLRSLWLRGGHAMEKSIVNAVNRAPNSMSGLKDLVIFQSFTSTKSFSGLFHNAEPNLTTIVISAAILGHGESWSDFFLHLARNFRHLQGFKASWLREQDSDSWIAWSDVHFEGITEEMLVAAHDGGNFELIKDNNLYTREIAYGFGYQGPFMQAALQIAMHTVTLADKPGSRRHDGSAGHIWQMHPDALLKSQASKCNAELGLDHQQWLVGALDCRRSE